MAKEKSEKSEKKERKEKKEKKSKKSADEGGVTKVKKSKRDSTAGGDVTTAVLNSLEEDRPGSVAVDAGNGEVVVRVPPPIGALVPFANPLAEERVQKKVLKSVKQAAKNKCLKRGVKEVVKSLRKSPAVSGQAAPGIVVLAADISPMDVISHIPVLCEDHNVPYIYVTSRAELGAAGSTKRPTSVVMVSPERAGKPKEGGEKEKVEGEKDFPEVYKDLLKVVEKEGRKVRI
ncbi:MAG: snoRNA-binding protein [Caeruleum heppii]|nr:MAG: snoRNA-binding protein [Caeruleum heppii]